MEQTTSKPTVKTIRDAHGRIWYCDATASQGGDMAGQGCVLADEWHYDRMFGG